MKIQVSTTVRAPMDLVWGAYSNPEDIVQWNAASDDWHTTRSSVDLRPGGAFSSRMEAKDGSFGFDFEGIYTTVVVNSLIEYEFGDRKARVEFSEQPRGVLVDISFDAESIHLPEQQREGWQAILDRFQRHVEAKA
ncbi:MAG: SRPBCC domain-containing protein [Arenimonas sp.]|nr:SRPBCC domain-containing protein [Arenimonas sp.]